MVLDQFSRPRYPERGASCALDRLRHRYALRQPIPSVPAPREMLRYIKTHKVVVIRHLLIHVSVFPNYLLSRKQTAKMRTFAFIAPFIALLAAAVVADDCTTVRESLAHVLWSSTRTES
jgi:hypothetical protein